MSNSILTSKEREIALEMLTYLRARGKNALADRYERVLGYVGKGLISRPQFLAGVVRECSYRCIALACRERDSYSILRFSMFLESNGEYSRNKTLVCLDHFAKSC